MQFIKPFKMNIFSGLGGSGGGYGGGGATVQNPATTGQANTQYQNAQDALAQQTGLVNSLQAQNGIQNQSNVFNQQQGLANQLQAQTQGAGPNPAQAALAQNTAANTANQASLMAGQRGTGANAGLIARQAAQQGAANQQASVGQAATLQAQQQLAAQQQLQQQQQAMAGLSTQQTGQLQNAIGGQNQFAQGEQQNILNAIAAQNNAAVGMQSNINNVNAGIQGGNQSNQAGLLGGGLGAIGSAFSLAGGGEVPDADVNSIQLDAEPKQNTYGPISTLGKALQNKPGAAQQQSAMFLNPSVSTAGGQNSSKLGQGFQSMLTSGGKNLFGSGAADTGGGATEVEGGPAISGGAGGEGAVTSEDIGASGAGAEGAGGAGVGAAALPVAVGAGILAAQKGLHDAFKGQTFMGQSQGFKAVGKAYGGDTPDNRPGNNTGIKPRAADQGGDPYGNYNPNVQQQKPNLKEKSDDDSVKAPNANVGVAPGDPGYRGAAGYSRGGNVPVVVSPGEKLYSPGGAVEKVPGQAKVKGDSYANDTVPKSVKPGTIVVPRSKADGNKKEAQFVAAILARRGHK